MTPKPIVNPGAPAGPTLEDAIVLAAQAHRGQLEKAGRPYILHPLRVMLGVATETERIAAVLHDVVEDTQVTLADIAAAGFASEVVVAVDALTHRADESYEDYVERAAANPIAHSVKVADLRDNMDLSRFEKIEDRDLARLKRYVAAWQRLTGGTKG